VSTQRLHDDWERFGPDFGKVGLARCTDRECQPLERRQVLRVNTIPIAAWIDAVPANIREPHGIQSVQTVGRGAATEAQTLIAQSRRQAIGRSSAASR
jgi:hypothetical protein